MISPISNNILSNNTVHALKRIPSNSWQSFIIHIHWNIVIRNMFISSIQIENDLKCGNEISQFNQVLFYSDSESTYYSSEGSLLFFSENASVIWLFRVKSLWKFWNILFTFTVKLQKKIFLQNEKKLYSTNISDSCTLWKSLIAKNIHRFFSANFPIGLD